MTNSFTSPLLDSQVRVVAGVASPYPPPNPRWERHRERLMESLRQHPQGETQTKLAAAAGMDTRLAGAILTQFQAEGVVVATNVPKHVGFSSRNYSGWRLANAVEGTLDAPQVPDDRAVNA